VTGFPWAASVQISAYLSGITSFLDERRWLGLAAAVELNGQIFLLPMPFHSD